MVKYLSDIANLNYFLAGASFFTFLSWLGRTVPSLSSGILVSFLVFHVIAVLLGLGCIAIYLGNRGNDDKNAAVMCLVACLPAVVFLFLVWLGSGLGFWIGG